MANSFITTSFLYFYFSNPDSLICLQEDRNAVCVQEYNPVCALQICGDESPNGYCEKTINNPCNACSDPTVVGYIKGDCGWNPVRVCSNPEKFGECSDTEIGGTVCGITLRQRGARNDLNKVIYQNGCEACNVGGVDFTLGGEAHDMCLVISTSTICRPQDRTVTNCPRNDALGACAYYQGGDCTEPICRRNARSWCHACLEDDVIFYLNGRCEYNVPIPAEGLPLAENDFDQDEDGGGEEEETGLEEGNEEDLGVWEEEQAWRGEVLF